MLKARRIALVAVIVFVVLVKIVFAFDNNDLHYRFANTILWSINTDWKMYLYEEFNLGDDAGNFYAHADEAGVIYSGLAKWFDLTLAYFHLDEKTAGRKWLKQEQPNVSGTIKWKLFDCDINNKLRFEHVFRQKADNGWRHRNIIVVTLPFKWTKLEIQPYFVEEVWYDFEAEYLTLQEFTQGLNLKLTKDLGAAIFCILSDSHSRSPDKWKRTNIIGTKLTWSF